MINKSYYLSICKEAQDNMNAYKSEAEERVTSWEHTKGKRYDLTPYYFERKHESRARVLKTEGLTAYGLDQEGHIWITKNDYILDSYGYRSISENKLINRIYRKNVIDSIEEVVFENGLPIRYVQFIVRNGLSLESSWHFEEYYEYEDQKIKTIKRDEYWGYGQGERHYEYYLTYSDAGKLSQIKDQKNKVIYLDISNSEATALRSKIRSELIAESKNVLMNICELVCNKKICFVAIYLHDEPHAVCDPIFHPGLEEIRLEQLKQTLDINYIWSSGEHPVNYQETIKNKELLVQFERLIQYWEMKGKWWDEAKKLWQEIAQELNNEDWNKHCLLLTDDFIFFVDEEGLNVKKDLAKSIPADKLNLLKVKGLYKS